MRKPLHAPHEQRSREAPPKGDPFRTRIQVPVAGGGLMVGLAGPPPEPGRPVVLAVHSMSTNHVAYRSVARELGRRAPHVSLIAPDLRGRGRSASLPPPFGIAQHVVDLVAVMDHVGAERVILAGWSMGCSFATRFALDHPDRIAAVVLLDGGLPMVTGREMPEPGPDEEEPPGLFDRFELQCATVDEYLDYWRAHRALPPPWDEDVEAFINADYRRDESGVHCVANMDALLADVQDLIFDGQTWASVSEVGVPIRLVRAERGMFDDDPVVPPRELEGFLRDNPHVSVETIADVNHFTILLGGGQGPHRVAAMLAEMAGAPASR
jgi:lipase